MGGQPVAAVYRQAYLAVRVYKLRVGLLIEGAQRPRQVPMAHALWRKHPYLGLGWNRNHGYQRDRELGPSALHGHYRSPESLGHDVDTPATKVPVSPNESFAQMGAGASRRVAVRVKKGRPGNSHLSPIPA